MKKLFAFILLLASLSVGCLFPTLGAFAISNEFQPVHECMGQANMQPDMSDMSETDSENMHKCCESPFLESINRSDTTSLSQSSTDVDDNIVALYVSYESLVSNNNDRLNSPPKYGLLFHDSLKNTYVSLVGIIKNNA